jgi:hypothetical protein
MVHWWVLLHCGRDNDDDKSRCHESSTIIHNLYTPTIYLVHKESRDIYIWVPIYIYIYMSTSYTQFLELRIISHGRSQAIQAKGWLSIWVVVNSAPSALEVWLSPIVHTLAGKQAGVGFRVTLLVVVVVNCWTRRHGAVKTWPVHLWQSPELTCIYNKCSLT